MRANGPFPVPNAISPSLAGRLASIHLTLDGHRGLTCWLVRCPRDTLHRHLTVHERKDDPAQASATATRSRVKRACQTCSQAKLRCDGRIPCGRCTSRGHPCRYVTSKASSKVGEE